MTTCISVYLWRAYLSEFDFEESMNSNRRMIYAALLFFPGGSTVWGGGGRRGEVTLQLGGYP